MAVDLECSLPEGADASGARLCDAVRAQMAVPPEDGIRLVVSVAQARLLRARLDVGNDTGTSSGAGTGGRKGPELATFVTDRDTFPDGALRAFATQLLNSIR